MAPTRWTAFTSSALPLPEHTSKPTDEQAFVRGGCPRAVHHVEFERARGGKGADLSAIGVAPPLLTPLQVSLIDREPTATAMAV